ncbi:MAG: rod shape-determining protein MreD [Proteobacteria bacterium]|nr:rod shape-determining protein MreD [Pseudomonadota bacterium]MDA1331496.1 rod shape-determining protein MreD [Pseudomonadota bacterium]
MPVLLHTVSNKKIGWSIVLGLFLSSVGLPGLSQSIAPDVLALIILYWATIGVGITPKMSTVFLLGLIVDVAAGGVIGIHSLKYLLILAVAMQLGNRFQMSTGQKKIALIVAMFLVLEIIVGGVVLIFIRVPMDIKSIIVAAMWGLTWPIVVVVLEKNYSRIGVK